MHKLFQKYSLLPRLLLLLCAIHLLLFSSASCLDCHVAHSHGDNNEDIPFPTAYQHVKSITDEGGNCPDQGAAHSCTCPCHIMRISIEIKSTFLVCLIENPYFIAIPKIHFTAYYPSIDHPPLLG
ncbi:hypothetical protein JW960_05095 [candidate division KSB1 bacterium]|nr:hypothetical protein [candidate division KSB1 bacterium]